MQGDFDHLLDDDFDTLDPRELPKPVKREAE